MTDGFVCPVEDCPFGEEKEKSRVQVERHIRAKGGEAHADSEALCEALDDQEPDAKDGEEDEAATEEGESSEQEESESTEESTEMPTDEEYEQQHSTASGADEPEDVDEDEADDDSDEGTESSDGGGFSLPFPALDQRTVLLLVAALGVLFLAYVVMNRGDEESVQAAETSEEDAESGKHAVSNEEVTLIE